MIVIKNLEKSFSSQNFQLGPINLEIPAGITQALFGHNGAGKSTMLQIITGNLDADSGHIKVYEEAMSIENYKLKKSIGYLPQHLTLPRWVTPLEILRYAAALYKLEDPNPTISEQLNYWDCENFAKRPIECCSHGMQKRVSLALATLHNPKLLILDEPFSGLDIYHIKALKEKILSREKRKEATIICTHMTPYAASLCSRASLLREGQLTSISEWKNANFEKRIEIVENHFS